MKEIRVALFDDNDLLRDSVSMLLQDAPGFKLVGSFQDCNRIVEDVKTVGPDVVIMDIDLPGISGIEAVKQIRKNFPEVQVLMQTVFDHEEKVFAAIQAGASGYILKNAESGNLLEAIKEVYRGGVPMTPSIARKVLQQFQTMHAPVTEDYGLSPREREVLALLVQGLSYKMISDKLSISYDTVRAHMKKIYDKLHVSSMTEAVAKAIHQKLYP